MSKIEDEDGVDAPFERNMKRAMKEDAIMKPQPVPWPPTHDQLLDEDGLKRVHREDDASWRHGSYRTEVYLRESDNTHWSTTYRLSTDGETNELLGGTATIVQVEPYQKTITAYRQVSEPKEAPDAQA